MKQILYRPIALLLSIAFLWQDVVWANPDAGAPHRSTHSLQVPSAFQPFTVKMQETYLESMLEYIVKSHPVISTGDGLDLFALRLTPAIRGVDFEIDFPSKKQDDKGDLIVPCSIRSGMKVILYEAVINLDARTVLLRKAEQTKSSQKKYTIVPDDKFMLKLNGICEEASNFIERHITEYQDADLSILCEGFSIELKRRCGKAGIRAAVVNYRNSPSPVGQNFVLLPEYGLIVDLLPQNGTYDMKIYAQQKKANYLIFAIDSPEAKKLYPEFKYTRDTDPEFEEHLKKAYALAESIEARESIRNVMDKLPYVPDWLDSRVNGTGEKAKEIIAGSPKLAEFIKKLEPYFKRKKYETLILHHGVLSGVHSYTDASNIVSAQKFDWRVFDDNGKGKSLWTYEGQFDGKGEEGISYLEMDFKGNVLYQNGGTTVFSQVETFVQTSMTELNGLGLYGDSTPAGYICDLILSMYGVEAVDYSAPGSGRVIMVKKQDDGTIANIRPAAMTNSNNNSMIDDLILTKNITVTASDGEKFAFELIKDNMFLGENAFRIKAKYNGKLVGYIDVQDNHIRYGLDSTPDYLTTAVNVSYEIKRGPLGRYKGIGTALMSLAMQFVKQKGFHDFRVYGSDAGSMLFYEKLGFERFYGMEQEHVAGKMSYIFKFNEKPIPEIGIKVNKAPEENNAKTESDIESEKKDLGTGGSGPINTLSVDPILGAVTAGLIAKVCVALISFYPYLTMAMTAAIILGAGFIIYGRLSKRAEKRSFIIPEEGPKPPSILESAKILMMMTADKMKMHPILQNIIMRPKKITTVSFDIKLQTGEVVKFWAFRALQNDARGAGKGGLRWLVGHGETLEEAKLTAVGLATLMTVKNSVIGIPYGGGKGDIFVENREYTDDDKALIFRAFSRELTKKNAIGTYVDVPAPDQGTDARMMVWFLDEHLKTLTETGKLTDKVIEKALKNISSSADPKESPYISETLRILKSDKEGIRQCPELGVVTGKEVGKGGSRGRTKATGFGGFTAFRAILGHLQRIPDFDKNDITIGLSDSTKSVLKKKISDMTVAIQGSGNVGEYNAWDFYRTGAKITLFQDVSGTLYNKNGIDIASLSKALGRTSDGRWLPFSTLPREYLDANGITFEKDSSFFWEKYTDIKVPAATQNQITMKNAAKVNCGIILELANNPTTPQADRILRDRGILVIPDVLANVGGVTVSYFEWLQNIEGRYWNRISVDKMLEERINKEAKSVFGIAVKEKCTLREAAFKLSLSRVANAELARSPLLRAFFWLMKIFRRGPPYEGYDILNLDPETVEELANIKRKGRYDELIDKNEKVHTEEIGKIVNDIDNRFAKGKRGFVLVSGAVTSGKIAFSERVTNQLAKLGRRTERIDMDLILNTHLGRLKDYGAISQKELYRLKISYMSAIIIDILRTAKDEDGVIYVIEGDYVLGQKLLKKGRGILKNEATYGVFVNTAPSLKLKNNVPLTSLDIRLIRHLLTFNHRFKRDPLDIIREWPRDRVNNLRYVYPAWANADITFNSYLPYELPVLKPHVIPLLKQALKRAKKEKDVSSIRTIHHILSLMKGVPSVSMDGNVPRDSIIRQFIEFDKPEEKNTGPAMEVLKSTFDERMNLGDTFEGLRDSAHRMSEMVSGKLEGMTEDDGYTGYVLNEINISMYVEALDEYLSRGHNIFAGHEENMRAVIAPVSSTLTLLKKLDHMIDIKLAELPDITRINERKLIRLYRAELEICIGKYEAFEAVSRGSLSKDSLIDAHIFQRRTKDALIFKIYDILNFLFIPLIGISERHEAKTMADITEEVRSHLDSYIKISLTNGAQDMRENSYKNMQISLKKLESMLASLPEFVKAEYYHEFDTLQRLIGAIRHSAEMIKWYKNHLIGDENYDSFGASFGGDVKLMERLYKKARAYFRVSLKDNELFKKLPPQGMVKYFLRQLTREDKEGEYWTKLSYKEVELLKEKIFISYRPMRHVEVYIVDLSKDELGRTIKERFVNKDGGIKAINYRRSDGTWVVMIPKEDFESDTLAATKKLIHEFREISFRERGYFWTDAHNAVCNLEKLEAKTKEEAERAEAAKIKVEPSDFIKFRPIRYNHIGMTAGPEENAGEGQLKSFTRVGEELNLNVKAIAVDWQGTLYSGASILPHAREFLERAGREGVAVFISSDVPEPDNILSTLENAGLGRLVKKVFSGMDGTKIEHIRKIMEENNITSPKDLVIIGDTTHDMMAGRANKVPGILIINVEETGRAAKKYGAAAIMPDFSDLDGLWGFLRGSGIDIGQIEIEQNRKIAEVVSIVKPGQPNDDSRKAQSPFGGPSPRKRRDGRESKWDVFDRFVRKLNTVDLAVIESAEKSTKVGQKRKILRDIGIEEADEVDSAYLVSAIRKVYERMRVNEVEGKSDVAWTDLLSYGGIGRFLICYKDDSADDGMVAKIPRSEHAMSYSDIYIINGCDIARKRLGGGLAAELMVVDAREGNIKPFVFYTEDRGRVESKVAVVQKKILPLIDYLKPLGRRGGTETDIQHAISYVDKFKKLVIEMYKRGAVDIDTHNIVGNYGIRKSDDGLVIFDVGDLSESEKDAREFVENIETFNGQIFEALSEIDGVMLDDRIAEHFLNDPFKREDFIKDGRDLFGTSFDPVTSAMDFPYSEEDVRKLFVGVKLRERHSRSPFAMPVGDDFNNAFSSARLPTQDEMAYLRSINALKADIRLYGDKVDFRIVADINTDAIIEPSGERFTIYIREQELRDIIDGHASSDRKVKFENFSLPHEFDHILTGASGDVMSETDALLRTLERLSVMSEDVFYIVVKNNKHINALLTAFGVDTSTGDTRRSLVYAVTEREKLSRAILTTLSQYDIAAKVEIDHAGGIDAVLMRLSKKDLNQSTVPQPKLENIADAKGVVKTVLERTISFLMSQDALDGKETLIKERELVIAFQKDMKWQGDGKLKQLLDALDELKNDEKRGFPKYLKNFKIIRTYSDGQDLRAQLGDSADDANNCRILAFAPNDMDAGLFKAGQAVKPVFVDEGEKFDPATAYYPLLEMVTIALLKYSGKNGDVYSSDQIKAMLKSAGTKDEDLKALSINKFGDEEGFLVFHLIPNASPYVYGERTKHIDIINKFIRSAA